jgi:GNAT superfamily N-acetyltransferase
MAVESRHQKRGIGKWMLFEIMSQLVELATTTQIRYLEAWPKTSFQQWPLNEGNERAICESTIIS